jgi:NAD(P)-dependent dehydrogenase (short-subunit alcohol dehydrogenase family)
LESRFEQQPSERFFDLARNFPANAGGPGGAINKFARAGLSQANMVASAARRESRLSTRTLALEGRDSAIRVNAVAPVDTATNIAAMKPKDLKRWTKREDIAETVVFLASQAAAGITGQVIAVTGSGLQPAGFRAGQLRWTECAQRRASTTATGVVT